MGQPVSFAILEAVTSERSFASPDERQLKKFCEIEGLPQDLSNIELQKEFFAVAVLPGMDRGPAMEFGDVPKVFS